MKTMYKCELCGRIYDSEQLCGDCEKICSKTRILLENLFTKLFGTPLNKVEGIKDEIITNSAVENEIMDIKVIQANLDLEFNKANLVIGEIQANYLNRDSLPKFNFKENFCGGSKVINKNIQPCGNCKDLLQDKMDYEHLQGDNLICPECGTEWELFCYDSWDGEEEFREFWLELAESENKK